MEQEHMRVGRVTECVGGEAHPVGASAFDLLGAHRATVGSAPSQGTYRPVNFGSLFSRKERTPSR